LSNFFKIEWPPKSGRFKEFPEVDKAEWFGEEQAREKINPAQVHLVDELLQKLE
jgi:predicted NUDIX family NTP pyrophosphohydrolase